MEPVPVLGPAGGGGRGRTSRLVVSRVNDQEWGAVPGYLGLGTEVVLDAAVDVERLGKVLAAVVVVLRPVEEPQGPVVVVVELLGVKRGGMMMMATELWRRRRNRRRRRERVEGCNVGPRSGSHVVVELKVLVAVPVGQELCGSAKVVGLHQEPGRGSHHVLLLLSVTAETRVVGCVGLGPPQGGVACCWTCP